MFSEIILDRVNRLIDIQLAERRKQIPLEILKIKNSHNARGVLHSSMTILGIKEICEREIEIRAVLFWQNLVRVMQTIQVQSSDDLSIDLREFMKNKINSSHDELRQLCSSTLGQLFNSSSIERNAGPHSLENTRDHVIAKHEVEIDLYIDTLKSGSVGTNNNPISNYNFQGSTIGAVQTGPMALANVVQNLGMEDRNAIKQALDLTRSAIASTDKILHTQKNELVEIVDEAKNELDQKNPNNTRITSLLQTIASTIQTIASAHPAYQALKSALIPLGITLP